MKKDLHFVLAKFGSFFLKCLIPVIVMGLIFLDIKTFGNIHEASFVEFGQEFFLLATSLIFMYLAAKKDANGLWLVAGFFMCMFIRELDAYFDILFHGSWKYFALATAIFFTYKAWSLGKDKAIRTLAEYMENPSFTTMSIGLMTVLVFSRAMGMNKLWKLALGDNFTRVVKNIVEEGTELFGYSIIFLAALEYAYSLLKNKEEN